MHGHIRLGNRSFSGQDQVGGNAMSSTDATASPDTNSFRFSFRRSRNHSLYIIDRCFTGRSIIGILYKNTCITDFLCSNTHLTGARIMGEPGLACDSR